MTIAMTMVMAAVLWGQAVPPQPRAVTLDQAIAEALAAEPSLQAARVTVDVARGERQQAALRPNPDLSFEEREQAGGPDRQTTLSVDWPLDLFRRGPRIEVAARGVERADAAVRDRERLLAADVRARYGDALAAARKVEVLDGVVASSRQTYELLVARAREGAAPPLDRDVALVELRRLEGQRALEAGRLASAMAALKVLLGRAVSADLTLADSLEQLTGAGAREAVGAAPETERADVREGVAAVASARAETTLTRQQAKPEIGLFAGYMRMDQSFPQNGLSSTGMVEPIQGVSHNVSAGIRVSLPLFDRGQGSVAAALARETAAARDLDARRLAADGEVAAARARLDAAERALASYGGEAGALARRNVDVVRETYTLGRATLFDVLNEQRRYLDFETAYTDVLAEAFAAVTDLRRAKGAIQ